MTEAKLNEVIKKYTDNAEYVRQHGDLEGCMEFRELAEFLTECKKLFITCEDCVNREAILWYINYIMNHEMGKQKSFEYIKKYVEKLPSVTPARWIPVSERLPESAFGCLVTVEEDDRYGEPQEVLYPEFVGYDGETETWNNADGKEIPFDVIAWMPLPESWKGESE